MTGLSAAPSAAPAVPGLLEMAQAAMGAGSDARGVGIAGDAFRDDTEAVARAIQQGLASQGSNTGIHDNDPRDDTALVAHNIQLGLASQGGNSNAMLGLDGQGNIVGQNGGATDQMLGAPPAYSAGGIEGGFNSIFHKAAPPSGWFRMSDYYNQSPQAQANYGANTADAQRLSTNNWRLLPPQYRDPNYFQYNGNIIDRRLAHDQLTPKSVLGLEGGTGFPGYVPARGAEAGKWRTGRNSTGWGADEGYIGSLGGWGYVGGEVT